MSTTKRAKTKITAEALATLLGFEKGSFLYHAEFDPKQSIWTLYVQGEDCEPIDEGRETPEVVQPLVAMLLEVIANLKQTYELDPPSE